jgi:hypothetical protein
MSYLIKNKLSKKEMLEVCRMINQVESKLSYQRNYSVEIINAIKNNNFTVDVPYPVLHRWRENESTEGWLYLAQARHKRGQVKVGVTTLPAWKREQTYGNKYGYSISIVWKKWVRAPFSVEQQLKERLRKNLVSGLTAGDSNEWYLGDIHRIASLAESIANVD